ncbi:MAG TPA: TrkA C-terminal domain-containing protein, partial [Candidatus Tectomicrobia bacterium]
VTVSHDSCLVGRTLRELRIRSRTGASVVAVLRHGVVLLNPEPTHAFQAGDLVGVLGHTEQRQAFQELAQRRAWEDPERFADGTLTDTGQHSPEARP